MALCEDYPCCGHENASCGDTTDYEAIYFALFSNEDDDPYIDDPYCEE
jgi:hypothetical protein